MSETIPPHSEAELVAIIREQREALATERAAREAAERDYATAVESVAMLQAQAEAAERRVAELEAVLRRIDAHGYTTMADHDMVRLAVLRGEGRGS